MDMEIVTPFSTTVQPLAYASRCTEVLQGVTVSISMGINVDNLYYQLMMTGLNIPFLIS